MAALFGQRGVTRKVSDEELMACFMNSGRFQAVALTVGYADHQWVRRRLEDYLMRDVQRLWGQIGMPRQFWFRRDLRIEHDALAGALRRIYRRRYGVHAPIVEGDTIRDALRKALEAIGEEARTLSALPLRLAVTPTKEVDSNGQDQGKG